jgi:hypothetical protein
MAGMPFGGEPLARSDDDERGVVGGELDATDSDELVEYPSSFSPSDESMATAGMGCVTAPLRDNAMGRDLPSDAETGAVGGGERRRSVGGGEVLPPSDGRLALRSTELLFPPRRQLVADSDLETLTAWAGEAPPPSEVPPLITVVELGVKGTGTSSWSSVENRPIGPERTPNFPPRAAVMGTWSSSCDWG